MYAPLLFSFDPRHRFYRLYDLQLRHHEHSVCSAVSFPQRYVIGFRLFSPEERQRSSEVSDMSGAKLLSLSNLSVWYTVNHPVLSGFSLDLGTNEVVGLIGLNGAGKRPLSKPLPGYCRAIVWTAPHGTVSRSHSATRRSSETDTSSLRKIGLFSISHSGNIWRMWRRPMAYRCRTCPGW